ncbi:MULTISPECIES: glutathione synthase [Cysteiniphilum]|uniref:Glutathione synthetase n=1 Tax=Cysteiniphilum litorale TaxID=2056700 RepID=A0A8J3E804_9GAMM|nr:MULTISPECIES: glutathione synthase [Cysteiniphilum]GGF87502.1 glutathione synthetase [Cysteiniphilum litorale]
MRICFIMYPWERVEPKMDSTLRLIHECVKRGHTVAIATPSNLTIRDSVAQAYADVFTKETKVSSSFVSFYNNAKFKRCQLPLSGFDVIFMRDNPPLDNLALNFLDSIHSDTFIMNSLNGLRIANNKLYTAGFNDHENRFIPVTHASKNREYLQRVLEEEAGEKMILKPLNGFGGEGVIVVEKKASSNFKSLLDFYIGDKNSKGNYVILQEYVDGAEEGDVRILMLNGEPIGAMKRVPAKDDIRSNVHAGGHVQKHSLSKQEKALCKFIGPKLVEDGLYFVGIDVINGKLIEVNVQSPGGISRINMLNKVKLQEKVIDFLENIVVTRKNLIKHKKLLTKVIDDANANDQ